MAGPVAENVPPSIIVIVVDLAFGKPCLLKQRLAEHILVLAEDSFGSRLRGCRQVVLNVITALGDGQFIPRPQRPCQDSLTIHLQPIRAAQIADLPEAGVLVGQFAVQTGDVGKLQTDVTRFAASRIVNTPLRKDRIAPTDRNQFTEMLRCHSEPPLKRDEEDK